MISKLLNQTRNLVRHLWVHIVKDNLERDDLAIRGLMSQVRRQVSPVAVVQDENF